MITVEPMLITGLVLAKIPVAGLAVHSVVLLRSVNLDARVCTQNLLG